MNLKDFFASHENPPELYWSLIVEPGWVQAGIWYIGEEAANIVSVSPGAAWETEEELIGAVDAALSSSVQKLPENYKEPNKTVFGVPSNWVEGGEIKEEYLGKIKSICTELSLTPVGFVVLSEAVAHLFKSEEGAPVNAIVVGLGKEFLEISIFKLGNLAGTTSVARSVSIVEDVTEGLSRFEGASPLPSRFIIYDGKEGELEEAKDAIIQANWEAVESIRFLHTPKVEVLSPERKVYATSLAGANEIGNVTKVESEKGEETPATPAAHDLENVQMPEKGLSAEELGFTVGKDISQGGGRQEPSSEIQTRPVGSPLVVGAKVGNYIQKTKNILHGLSIQKNFGLAAVALFILIAIFGLYWWFFPTAKVSIVVTPKSFSEEVNASLSISGESDIGSGVIPAQEITAQVLGDKTQATTGKKVVGDKAKGGVNILNFTPSIVTLAAGTPLSSSGNLRFSIDNQASVSGVVVSGSENVPGSASVNVTAFDIGAEYNLAKDEIFSVGNYSKINVRAQATENFSGGTSRDISAVNKTDQDSLEKALKDELSQNAKEELKSKVGENQIFVDDLTATNVASETFDHKIGDEAGNLKLSLTLDTKGLAVDREKFLEFARGILKDNIPQGFVLKDSQIGFKFSLVGEKDGKFDYKVTLSANFLPDVRVSEVVKEIAGKTPVVAKSFLSEIPGFVRAEVKLKPNLPGPFGTLPRVPKNISIEVTPE